MKISIGKKTLLYAHPVLIAGSYDADGKPNLIAVSWGGICSSDPPCVTISIRKSRYSYESIIRNQAYTINIPSVKYVREADYTGTHSGKDCNKFEDLGLTPVKSELVYAPYVEEFPVNLMCKLINTIDVGVHTQMIGEIVDLIADESVIGSSGLPDIEKVNPFIYDTASRGYFEIGKRISDAYTALKK